MTRQEKEQTHAEAEEYGEHRHTSMGEKLDQVLEPHLNEKSDNKLGHMLNKRHWRRFAWLEWGNIDPIKPEEQQMRHPYVIALIWVSMNLNVLSFSTGMVAPDMGFEFRYFSYTTLGFLIGWAIFPAAFTIFGHKLGMRQMVHARYSFGYFGAPVPALLTALTGLGYGILNAIVAGETLQAVSPHGSMSATVGIVIVTVMALAVSFCGIRVLNVLDMVFWLPVLISFAILAGEAKTGPEGLHVLPQEPRPTARNVLGLGSLLSGFYVSYASMSSDISMYYHRDRSSWLLFIISWIALLFAAPPILMLGAAFATSSQRVPAWNDAVTSNPSPGPLINLVLSTHLGNFGKFLTVLIALSAASNMMTSFYSIGLCFQTALPPLRILPRFLFPIAATAIVLPLAIVGQTSFYSTLSNFLSVIGYWSALYVAVVIADFVIIRRCRMSSYDVSIWNDWRKLPPGIAAMTSCVLSLGLVVPFMDQAWFTGPLGKHVGDLGFELGLAVTFVLYCVLRPIEQRLFQR